MRRQPLGEGARSGRSVLSTAQRDHTEIQALVSLLADDDPRISAMVWEHLVRLGSSAYPALREACEAADPRLRLRARHALQQLVLDEVERELRETSLPGVASFDLERALCALSRIEDPEASQKAVSATLDEMAALARPHLKGLRSPLLLSRTLNQVFHDELKFTLAPPGDVDPRLLSLHRVLQWRRGLPLSLATVYLLLAERLQLPLRAVGLPSRVLVKVVDQNEEFYIDPSGGNRAYSRKECYLTFLRDYIPRDSYIQELGARELTARVLRSLLVLYSEQHNRKHIRRLSRMLEILQVRERPR